MIEDIKKEILDSGIVMGISDTTKLHKILDKYKGKEKERSGLSKEEVNKILEEKIAYKNAWEELKENKIAQIQELNYYEYETLDSTRKQQLSDFKEEKKELQELEQKYNISNMEVFKQKIREQSGVNFLEEDNLFSAKITINKHNISKEMK